MSVEAAKALAEKVRKTKEKVNETMDLLKQLKIRYKKAKSARETAEKALFQPCEELNKGIEKLETQLKATMCTLTDHMIQLDVLRHDTSIILVREKPKPPRQLC